MSYPLRCQRCNKQMPAGYKNDCCPSCEGHRIGEKLVEEFKWNLLNSMGPPGINECVKHHKKEWISKNCPYCALAEVEAKLKAACNEIKVLVAQVRVYERAAKDAERIRKNVDEGKY